MCPNGSRLREVQHPSLSSLLPPGCELHLSEMSAVS